MTNVTDRASANAIEERKLRDVLGCFATGVAVATTLDQTGRPMGLTINSFNSVSMNPPLVLWSLACEAASHTTFASASAFAINILSKDQTEVCMRFAKPAEDKFSGVDWTAGYGGMPVLSDALATLECALYRQYEGGDHTIFIGRVVGLSASEKAPLIYHRGKFTGLASVRLPGLATCAG